MKCRICGARLATEGDICMDCYKELQEEKALKSDTKEKYVLRRKYLIAYNVAKTWQAILLALLVVGIGIYSLNIWCVLLGVLLYAIYLAFVLAIDKHASKNQKIVFYEKKATYKKKSIIKFLNKEKTVKYSEFGEVRVDQTRLQKKYNLADIIIYTDDVLGLSYFKGIRIRNVLDPEKVLTQIGAITNLVRK